MKITDAEQMIRRQIRSYFARERAEIHLGKDGFKKEMPNLYIFTSFFLNA